LERPKPNLKKIIHEPHQTNFEFCETRRSSKESPKETMGDAILTLKKKMGEKP